MSVLQARRYHMAHKNISSVNGTVPGIKLEQFIFDPFPLASMSVLVEVHRGAEFAPVKNASAPNKADTPETARRALMQLHRQWVEAAGGVVRGGSEGVEVSPMLSYAGEGLSVRCHEQSFQSCEEIT